eukprot:CAMPEP_0198142406 /NCGR_PEP_ID=MMETSP1443-20131203/5197_1 /TAXON_ID=186043 /ORGANISM="Entomoneis sp., Strain CCMP2396" /LENGTH=208 /DNA_ID=CAMNT_0043805403 /DNA_START=103 /DNA_END=729 /DNA_ORIENTATION=+
MVSSKSPEVSEVVVRPGAFCGMVLHAVQHPNDVVHGLLLGSFDQKKITVQDAVPVCHGAPTLPLIETAIGLVEVQIPANTSIVGWYTAPMLLDDTKSGSVAMRMATNLETDKKPSTLIVLKNSSLSSCMNGVKNDAAKEALQAYGKDFGKQYQEAIQSTVENGAGACSVLSKAKGGGISCKDLEDNMDDPSSSWFPNKALDDIVKSVL